MVKKLIERHADVNAETKDGRTPLSLAKNTGDKELIKLLRFAGAVKQ